MVLTKEFDLFRVVIRSLIEIAYGLRDEDLSPDLRGNRDRVKALERRLSSWLDDATATTPLEISEPEAELILGSMRTSLQVIQPTEYETLFGFDQSVGFGALQRLERMLA